MRASSLRHGPAAFQVLETALQDIGADIARGDQGEARPLSRGESGESTDAKRLRRGEIALRRFAHRLRLESGLEGIAGQSLRSGDVDEHGGLRHVAAVAIERSLDRLEYRACLRGSGFADRDDRAARGLGVVDEAVAIERAGIESEPAP